jgi:hypothetical protein
MDPGSTSPSTNGRSDGIAVSRRTDKPGARDVMSGRARLPAGAPLKASQRGRWRAALIKKIFVSRVWCPGDRVRWRARLALCYGFLQGAWPFGLVEAIWAGAAVYHRRQRAKHAQRPARRKCPVNVIGHPVREVVRIASCQEAWPVQAASAAGRFQTGPAGQPFLNGCPGRPVTFTRML